MDKICKDCEHWFRVKRAYKGHHGWGYCQHPTMKNKGRYTEGNTKCVLPCT